MSDLSYGSPIKSLAANSLNLSAPASTILHNTGFTSTLNESGLPAGHICKAAELSMIENFQKMAFTAAMTTALTWAGMWAVKRGREWWNRSGRDTASAESQSNPSALSQFIVSSNPGSLQEENSYPEPYSNMSAHDPSLEDSGGGSADQWRQGEQR